MLTRPANKAEVKATGALGSVVPNKSISEPVLAALGDYRPKTLGQIEQEVTSRGVNLINLVQLVMTLLETNSLSPAQDDAVTRAARKQTDKLNAYLCDKAPYRAEAGSVLASPVTGAGLIDVGRVVQFFRQGVSQGKKQPNQLATHAAQLFRSDIMLQEDEKRFVPADGNLDADLPRRSDPLGGGCAEEDESCRLRFVAGSAFLQRTDSWGRYWRHPLGAAERL